MSNGYNKTVAFRITEAQQLAVDQLVNSGTFKTTSAALRHFVDVGISMAYTANRKARALEELRKLQIS